MGIEKTPTLISSVDIVSAGSSQDSSGFELTESINHFIGVSAQAVAYNGGYATDNTALLYRIELYGDPSGASASFTIGSKAIPFLKYNVPGVTSGQTYTGRASIPIPHAAKYAKARIVPYNLSNGLRNVRIYHIQQKKV